MEKKGQDMTNYARELQRRLTGEEEQENPLEVIGLSPEILDLGLSEDQLYRQCQRFATGLLAAVHPDVHGGMESPAVLRFSETANRLKDRQTFKMALDEFREMNAYERANVRTLRAQVQNLQEKSAYLEGQLRTERAASLQAAEIQERIDCYFFGASVRFSKGTPVKSLVQCKQVTVAKITVPFPKDKLEEGTVELTGEQREVLSQASQSFPSMLHGRKVVFTPKRLPLMEQRLVEGPKSALLHLYVLGTASLDVALAHPIKAPGVWVSTDQSLLYEIEPFLASGRVLVSRAAPKTPFQARSRGQGAWRELLERRERERERIRSAHPSLYLSHIVLDVE